MTGHIYYHHLDPVILQLGPLAIGWYGLMYALSFISVYWLMAKTAHWPGSPVEEEEVSNLLIYLILGVVLGGRLGYVLFYGGSYYWQNPLRILETWKGGMSFHGGMIGVAAALWLYGRNHQKSLLALGDFVVTWVPLGLFFGRIGNFINGELYGKPTGGSWGVVFPGDPLLTPRHPSQLYEAALEGLVALAVLVWLRRRHQRPGLQPAAFLVVYALARMTVETVRLPDQHIGYLWGPLTMGQLLSLPMLLAGLGWMVYIFRQPPSPAASPAAAPKKPPAATQGRGKRRG